MQPFVDKINMELVELESQITEKNKILNGYKQADSNPGTKEGYFTNDIRRTEEEILSLQRKIVNIQSGNLSPEHSEML